MERGQVVHSWAITHSTILYPVTNPVTKQCANPMAHLSRGVPSHIPAEAPCNRPWSTTSPRTGR